MGESTPNDELRELVEQWRMHDYKDGSFYRGMESCADELEELIDE